MYHDLLLQSTDKDMYRLRNKSRGEMLLINNEFFTVNNLPKRVGTLQVGNLVGDI